MYSSFLQLGPVESIVLAETSSQLEYEASLIY